MRKPDKMIIKSIGENAIGITYEYYNYHGLSGSEVNFWTIDKNSMFELANRIKYACENNIPVEINETIESEVKNDSK